jgi:hypothetical protein
MSDEFPIDVDGLDEETLRLLNQIRAKDDPETGTRTPRDLSKLKVSEAVELIRLLRRAAEFHKEPPSPSNIVARQLLTILNEKVREVAPDIPPLLEQESALTAADEAVTRLYEEHLREKSRFGKPAVYWGAALVVYLVSTAVGSLAVAVVGGAIALWAFWRSTLCVTFRAATWMRLADKLDGSGKAHNH